MMGGTYFGEMSKKVPCPRWSALTMTKCNAAEYLNWGIILESRNIGDLISETGIS